MFWGHQSPGQSVLSKGWNHGGKDWKEIHQNSIGRFVWMVAPILVCSFSSDFANFLSSSPCKIEMSEINCISLSMSCHGPLLESLRIEKAGMSRAVRPNRLWGDDSHPLKYLHYSSESRSKSDWAYALSHSNRFMRQRFFSLGFCLCFVFQTANVPCIF